jgi:hypothetical protein
MGVTCETVSRMLLALTVYGDAALLSYHPFRSAYCSSSLLTRRNAQKTFPPRRDQTRRDAVDGVTRATAS